MTSWTKKRSVIRSYDATAHIYNGRYTKEQGDKIEAALGNVRMDGRGLVLDAGCGTGLLFDYVADRTEATVGLDISRKTLLQTKEHKKNFANVHVVRADVDNMPLKSNIFRNVFAITLIQNTPDPQETLNEIKRVAGDSAVIVVTGLKKVITRETFEHLLRKSGLKVKAWEDEGLKCYVAVCTKMDLA